MDTGLKAIHPITNAEVNIFVANFVLMSYGSGAVMAVPGHDQRDWEFAKKYGLEIKQVIKPASPNSLCDLKEAAYVEKGILINSGEFDGLDFESAFEAIALRLDKIGKGQKAINYRLRDWGVSRQRYWGAPIPMINCNTCGSVPVPDEDLPVILPEDIEFDDSGSPLGKIQEFFKVECPKCHEEAQRETDTFDTFMESSWYYARFTCCDQDDSMLDHRANYWLPVDQYIGGIEHAILHLLYARFYHKLLRNEGLVNSDEPFTHLLTQGMVLKDGHKMSKSQGNTVDPMPLIEKYGADTVRMFVMFASPPDQSLDWSESGVEGSSRFLKRLWKIVVSHQPISYQGFSAQVFNEKQLKLRLKIHQTIQKVSDDFSRRQTFNTAIAAIMELINATSRFLESASQKEDKQVVQEALEAAILMLAPIAPHFCHALWNHLGHDEAVIEATWPRVDESALIQNTMLIVLQVNGKLRSKIEVPRDIAKADLERLALGDEAIQRFTSNGTVRKIIVVPKRLVNIVVN